MSRRMFGVVLVAMLAGAIVGYGVHPGVEYVRLDTPAEPGSEPAPRREPPPVAAPRLPDSTIEQIAARSPVPEFETGDGVITGTVKTMAGEPIAGVRIVARRRGLTGTSWSEELTLAEKIRRTIKQHHFGEQTTRETMSGSDGTFRLTGLTDAGHRLSATADGYGISSRGNTYDVRPGATVTYLATPVCQAEFDILMPDGTTASSAMLEIKGPRGTIKYGWRPGLTVTAPGGKCRIQATGPDGICVSESVEVTYVTGAMPDKLTLRLRPRPGIHGTVTFADEVPSRGVTVALSPVHGSAEPDPSILSRPFRSVRLHGHDGYDYAMADVGPGTYLIGVLIDREPVVTDTVVVTDGPVERNLVVPAPDPSEVVYVRVLGPDGKPLEQVTLSTAYRSGRRSRSGGGQSVRMPDGRWRVRRQQDEDDEETDGDGHHYLSARSRSLGLTEVEYVPGKDREITIRFEVPGTLEVTISGYAGSGYEGIVRVLLQHPAEGRRTSGVGADVKMGNDGKTIIGPVVPGAYEIVLTAQQGDRGTSEVARYPVVVAAGENQKTIGMPRLYTLTVIAEGKYAKKRFGLNSKESSLRVWGKRPKDGKLVFRALPAGTYSVQLENDMSGGMMTVRVPGQTTVRFEPKTANALSVRITDPDGPFARAGLQTGDIVIGVNGEEFKSLREAQMKLFAGTEEPSRLLVLRGNRRLEISVDLKPMMEENVRPGARLDPVAR